MFVYLHKVLTKVLHKDRNLCLKSKEFIEFLHKKNIRKEAVIARVEDSLAVTQGVGFPKLGKEISKGSNMVVVCENRSVSKWCSAAYRLCISHGTGT